jgi:hypothetical protein
MLFRNPKLTSVGSGLHSLSACILRYSRPVLIGCNALMFAISTLGILVLAILMVAI